MLQGVANDRHEARSIAVDRVARACAFAHYFGLSRAPSAVLMTLFEAAGAFRSASQIATLTQSTARSAQVQIHLLRQALDVEAIDFSDGLGYALSDVGLADCREALRQMRESLAA